MAAQDWVH